MNQEVIEYIKTQRAGVLAVEMMDGSPHGATIHFAHTENPLMFLFETNREYRKCEALFGRKTTRATFVIGADEGNLKTLQMDGEVRLMTDIENEELFRGLYLEKFPKKKAKAEGPDTVAFLFIPKWWRFTDWTKPEGKLILTSD